MIDIRSGHPAIDRYLADGYERVCGMSSRFAAAICGHVIARQTSLGIFGDLVEIGTFEGRFFVAMALGLADGETAIGIDRFDWPDGGIEARFHASCAAHGIARERYLSWKADSRDITPAQIMARLGGRTLRFAHIDSHHSRECLANDLALVDSVLHPDGVVCLDDMLHPGYPALVATVLDYLARRPDMRLLCLIDREDIVAAGKFLLCRADAVPRYEADLMTAFAPFHFILGADMEGYCALVLTPQPRLPEIG